MGPFMPKTCPRIILVEIRSILCYHAVGEQVCSPVGSRDPQPRLPSSPSPLGGKLGELRRRLAEMDAGKPCGNDKVTDPRDMEIARLRVMVRRIEAERERDKAAIDLLTWIAAEATSLLSTPYDPTLCHACGDPVAFGRFCRDCRHEKHREQHAQVFFVWRIVRQSLPEELVTQTFLGKILTSNRRTIKVWMERNLPSLHEWDTIDLPHGGGPAREWGLDWAGEPWDHLREQARIIIAKALKTRTRGEGQFEGVNCPGSLSA